LSPRPSKDGGEKPINGVREVEKEPSVGDDVEPARSYTAPPTPNPSYSPPPPARADREHVVIAGSAHRRAATIYDAQTRAMKHERRSSTGAALLSGTGTVGRLRRPSTGYGGMAGKGLAERVFGRTQEEDEEGAGVGGKRVPAPLHTADGISGREGFKEEDERHGSEKDFKPVFLKGLFR
jgi:hypothetical protein